MLSAVRAVAPSTCQKHDDVRSARVQRKLCYGSRAPGNRVEFSGRWHGRLEIKYENTTKIEYVSRDISLLKKKKKNPENLRILLITISGLR